MSVLHDLHKGARDTESSESALKGLHASSTPTPMVAKETSSPKRLDFSQHKLVPFTDSRLLTKPPAFDFERPNYLEYAETPIAFAEGLFDRMLSLGGVGLSANQIGIPLRVFVFGNQTTRNYVFNPEIVGVSKETVLMEEGCLSFPGFSLTLKRPKQCGTTFQTETGENVVSTLDGIAARVFLHEFDHMEGLTFFHHASKFKLDWEIDKATKKLNKLGKRKAQSIKENNGKAK